MLGIAVEVGSPCRLADMLDAGFLRKPEICLGRYKTFWGIKL